MSTINFGVSTCGFGADGKFLVFAHTFPIILSINCEQRFKTSLPGFPLFKFMHRSIITLFTCLFMCAKRKYDSFASIIFCFTQNSHKIVLLRKDVRTTTSIKDKLISHKNIQTNYPPVKDCELKTRHLTSRLGSSLIDSQLIKHLST